MNKLLLISSMPSRLLLLQPLKRTLATQTPVNSGSVEEKFNVNELSKLQKMYMKRIDSANEQRYLKVMRKKKVARFSSFLLLCGVLSIYFYTMFAVKQEKFLDDFEIPDPPDKNGIRDQ